MLIQTMSMGIAGILYRERLLADKEYPSDTIDPNAKKPPYLFSSVQAKAWGQKVSLSHHL